MRQRRAQPQKSAPEPKQVWRLCDAPAWITPALIQQTLDCWQPHFAKALTTEDAIEILTNVGQLFEAIK